MKVSVIPAVFAGFAAAASIATTDANALEGVVSGGNKLFSWSFVLGKSAAGAKQGEYNLPSAKVTLYSGPDDGTSVYRGKYAPKVAEALKKVTGLELVHGDAKGTLDSIQKCAAQTTGICMFVGQGNLLVDAPEVTDGRICVVRPDLYPEHAYVFFNEAGVFSNGLEDYAEVRAEWEKGTVTLVTSETSTGSVKTLQDLEADIEQRLPGVDLKIKIVPDWDAVKQEVRNDKKAVGFTFRNGGGDTFLLDLQNLGFTVAGFAETELADNKMFANESPAFIYNEKAPYSAAGYFWNSDETTAALGSPVVLAMTCPNRIEGDVDRAVAILTQDLLSKMPRNAFSFGQ